MQPATEKPCSDPYATHAPVLSFVLDSLRPARVLEFGGGDYSTPLFLGCPFVRELCVVEVDEKWRRRLRRKYRDPRLTIRSKGRPDPSRFDLVFIDDGANARHREETIIHVLTRPHPTTVIHDAETYMHLISELSRNYELFSDNPPATAVCR